MSHPSTNTVTFTPSTERTLGYFEIPISDLAAFEGLLDEDGQKILCKKKTANSTIIAFIETEGAMPAQTCEKYNSKLATD